MKTLFLTGLICLSTLMSLLAQSDSLRITGHVTGFEDSTLLYFFPIIGNAGSKSDSVWVMNNTFSITYALPETPNRILLATTDFKTRLSIWTENTELTITGDYEHFGESKVKGSPINDVARVLMAADTNHEATLSLVRSHIGYEPAITKLFFMKEKLARDTLQQLYNLIPASKRDYDYAKQIAVYLEMNGTQVPKVGDSLINHQAFDPDGKSYSFSELNDRYLLIEFGSSYCGPCFMAVPELSELQMEAAEQLNIVSFSVDTREVSWRNGLKRMAPKETHAHLLHLWDGEGQNGKIPILYGIRGIPQFYLFDPQGTVVAKWTGYEEGIVQKKWEEVMVDK